MIVPMKKVSLIVLSGQKEDALKKLRRLGLMHIEIAEGSGERISLPVSYTHLDVYKRQGRRLCRVDAAPGGCRTGRRSCRVDAAPGGRRAG